MLGRRHADERRVADDGDLLAGFADSQTQIDRGALSHHQIDAGADLFAEAGFCGVDFVLADGERDER